MHIVIARRAAIDILDGVNRFIFELAKGFLRLCHKVTLICHHFEANGLALGKWNIPRSLEILTLKEKTTSRIKLLWDWLVEGSKLIKKIDPDAVIINGIVPLKTDRLRIGVVHGPREEYEPRILEKLTYRFLCRYFTDIRVAVSSNSKVDAEHLGVRVDRIIPITLDITRYLVRPLEERENVVVHIGTAPRKNPEISILCIKKLVERGFKVRLQIIGSRNQHILELMQKFSGKQWLEFKLEVSDNELRESLSMARVLILPSRREAFSYVTLEAQASGTPVVVSTAVPEEALVHEVTGFRVDSFEPAVYAKLIERLISNDDLWYKMSINARRYAERFHVTKIAHEYIELIKQYYDSQ